MKYYSESNDNVQNIEIVTYYNILKEKLKSIEYNINSLKESILIEKILNENNYNDSVNEESYKKIDDELNEEMFRYKSIHKKLIERLNEEITIKFLIINEEFIVEKNEDEELTEEELKEKYNLLVDKYEKLIKNTSNQDIDKMKEEQNLLISILELIERIY